MKRMISHLAIISLFASAPGMAGDWETIYDGALSVVLASPGVKQGDSVSVQILDYMFDVAKIADDMESGRKPDRNRFTVTRSDWTIDCKGFRAKSENTSRSEGLKGRWRPQREEDMPWQSLTASDFEQDPLLSYACKSGGSRATWQKPEQARDAKWEQVLADLREAAKLLDGRW